MVIHSILWQNLQFPGHEACWIYLLADQWHLEGTAVFSYEMGPCQLKYHIICNDAWHTLSGIVEGRVADKTIDIRIKKTKNQQWQLNGVEISALSGCTDIDLNFSPCTNTIAIRRLNLEIGDEKEIVAAWLRFPTFALEPLPQSYLRLEEHLYRYQSGGGSFIADLRIDRAGFVIDYPGAWKAEIRENR